MQAPAAPPRLTICINFDEGHVAPAVASGHVLRQAAVQGCAHVGEWLRALLGPQLAHPCRQTADLGIITLTKSPQLPPPYGCIRLQWMCKLAQLPLTTLPSAPTKEPKLRTLWVNDNWWENARGGRSDGPGNQWRCYSDRSVIGCLFHAVCTTSPAPRLLIAPRTPYRKQLRAV